MRRALLLLLALGIPGIATAAEGTGQLAPFKATYAIKWKGMSAGIGELALQRLPDGRWSYSSAVRSRGLAKLFLPDNQKSHSVFRIVNDRVVPDSYESDEHDQQISFDWPAGRVTGTVKRERINLPTQPGLLDPLSVQVALMHELLSGRMPARFVLVDEEKIKDYLYAVEGSEKIESVAGEFRTDIFSSRRPGSRKATYFWCARDLDYLPLKVERREGRDVQWSMSLTSLERR